MSFMREGVSLTSPLEGLHAVGYARVSTEDKGQDTGIQVNEINRWAETNGVIMDKIIQEEISGAIWPRPGLSEAIISVMTSSASMLVCYDQSRLTRDAKNQLPLIEKMLGDKVVRYVVNGDADPDSFGVKIMSAVKGVSDSEERKILKQKTRLSMAYRRDTLHIHVGRPAKLIIADSTEGFNKGLIGEKTIILKPSKVLSFAREGWPPNYVSVKLLNVPPVTFLRALERAGLKEQYYQIMQEAGTQ